MLTCTAYTIIVKHKQIGDNPKVICCQTYRPQPIEHVWEPMPRIIHHYQTRQRFTEEGNLSGPIRTGHNQHTHTGNTRQPELNSRVPRVHPPSRARLEGCHSELNSRNNVMYRLTERGLPLRANSNEGERVDETLAEWATSKGGLENHHKIIIE
ncbi:hypothetical protein DEO72_LG9g1382 [Vigna unguiculata]|uniref:Uncharacterized protein n=1 Tax=Vigna unguiculata TaxID=3917 RepID=A0A4D6MXX0_VIGUN|nr:hypothetical protein DEO72_LG9g1382 [Vigna unguiculata]